MEKSRGKLGYGLWAAICEVKDVTEISPAGIYRRTVWTAGMSES